MNGKERGTGAAEDGSPVPAYAALPLEPEFTPVLEAIAPPATVLDLGCGAGRLANHLAAEGFTVTGVDQSEAMLAHLREDVTGVRADIQSLELDRRFDIVVLASHLVNMPDRGLRQAFLRAGQIHTRPGGAVYIEHYDHVAIGGVTESEGAAGPVRLHLRVLARRGPEMDGVVTYTLDGRSWTQEFTTRLLDETELRAELELAGLALRGRLSPTWIVAEPV